jgi:bifunctional enzyme CysN/CysC
MPIVIGGHVDHGKSTIIGRLLADTDSLPDGKLEQVKALCQSTGRPFEYAFLLDALKDEQAQGITIDSARVFFKSAQRHYIIIDAPGHVEFLRNMVTGAARAEAALLVIDAKEGVRENSRRHGYLMSMLGIRQIAVLVNKMDLVDYERAKFEAIVREFGDFLDQLDVRPSWYLPVSGRSGDNIAARTTAMPWYEGPTVLEALDGFALERPAVGKPFRMPVQDVYKFTGRDDDRRIVAGTVDSGTLRTGDELVFYPSGKRSHVKSIEAFNRPPQDRVLAGEAAGLTLTEQIYVARGELVSRAEEPPPRVAVRVRVSLFWLGREPLVKGAEYLFKLGTAKIPCRLEEVARVIDASTLGAVTSKEQVDRHEVAECVLVLARPAAFDLADEIAPTSRFVVVSNYEIRGGGIVREALSDKQSGLREKVMRRNFKWEPSIIPATRRAERYGQRASLLLVTGAKEAHRKELGKELEAGLFEDGRLVYFIGIGNVLYGVDADIDRRTENRGEHFRRLGEVVNIMLDAGLLVIVSAADLAPDDLDILTTAVDPDRIHVIWVGDPATAKIRADLVLGDHVVGADAVDPVKRLLQEKGALFRPW